MSDAARPWQVLMERRGQGVRLGVSETARAYAALGRPGAGVPTVHIVGTNGKGSTAMFVEHALRRHGWRTGLYTSPHLHRWTERVRVDGEPVDEGAFADGLAEVLAIERQGIGPLSFFELLTLAGLCVFRARGVRAQVIEAGLGGVGDATAVVDATAVGITSIAMDHGAVLGPTLRDIARNKAGVMVGGRPAISAPQSVEVMAVLTQVAEQRGAVLEWLTDTEFVALADVPGRHQANNAAVALRLARTIEPAVDAADLAGVVLAGRAERLPHGGGVLVLDVAHNPAGVGAVVDSIASKAVARPSLIVWGSHPDKDVAGMAARLGELGVPTWWVHLGESAAVFRGAARVFDSPTAPTLGDALAEELGRGATVLVCGSHRVVGAVRAWARGESRPADAQDPRVGDRSG